MRKLKKLSIMLIFVGTIFIFIGCISDKIQKEQYTEQIHNKSTFTLNINNEKKANIKVLGYKPDSNTKETILEAYGNVTIKQNNDGVLEITLDTEEGGKY